MVETDSLQNVVSAAFTKSLIRYLETRGKKDDALAILHEAGYSREQMEDPHFKIPLEDNVRIAEMTETALGKSGIMAEIALESSNREIHGVVQTFFAGFMSIPSIIRAAEKGNADHFFNNCMPMEIVEIRKSSAVVRIHYVNGAHGQIGKVNCDYVKGMLASLATLAHMPPAQVEERCCAVDLEKILARESVIYEKNDGVLVSSGTALAEKTERGYIISAEVRRKDGSMLLPKGKVFSFTDSSGDHYCEYEIKWTNPAKRKWVGGIAGMAVGILGAYLGKDNGIMNVLWTALPISGYMIAELVDYKQAQNSLVAQGELMRADLEKTIMDLQSSNLEKTKAYIGVIKSHMTSLENKDPYTRKHSDRCQEYAEKIARQMQWPGESTKRLKVAAELHDIGKIGIEDYILNKPGKLSDDEFVKMKTHPLRSKEILEPLADVLGEEAVRWVALHHERVDGRGYPHGVSGKGLPMGARILSVVDAYDAMTSDRPYRKGLPPEEAARRLVEGKGTQFDPEVVDALVAVMKEEKII